MIKFYEIGMYDNAVNVPYCTVPDTITNGVKNGYGVTYSEKTKTIALPTATTAKSDDLAIVMNVIDKPETLNPDDYTVEVGEFARLFRLDSLADRLLLMNDLAVTTAYGSIDVDDTLVVGTDGKWVKETTLTGYAYYLTVIEKNSFCGNGLLVKVTKA